MFVKNMATSYLDIHILTLRYQVWTVDVKY